MAALIDELAGRDRRGTRLCRSIRVGRIAGPVRQAALACAGTARRRRPPRLARRQRQRHGVRCRGAHARSGCACCRLRSCRRHRSRMLGGALFTSHEALLLPFEQALIRRDAASGRWFAGSAHFLWIGARTLFPGSAHVELLRGLANPIGLKCGPDLAPDDLLAYPRSAEPGSPGRPDHSDRRGWERADRVGAAAAAAGGAPLRASGALVLRSAARQYGPWRRMASSAATWRGSRRRRAPSSISSRTRARTAGGLHLELTHRAVAECDGAGSRDDCRDPRLNPDQARRIARLFAAARTRSSRARARLSDQEIRTASTRRLRPDEAGVPGSGRSKPKPCTSSRLWAMPCATR